MSVNQPKYLITMRKTSNILNCCVIAFISLSLIITSPSIAQTSGPLLLSYKILESYSDDTTLTMIVKLRVKNVGLTPVEQVVIQVNNNFNASILGSAAFFDLIKANKTVLSTDDFIISINKSLLEQGPPDSSITWGVEYIDAEGFLKTEEIVL